MLGNARTPVRFTLSPQQAGSAVAEIIMATRTRADVADLLGETGWARCATSERGWTRTLGSDTSSSDDTGNGGSGNSAQVDGVTGGNTATSMLRRTRITRITKLDSLRGWERVFLRARMSAAAVWEIQMKYSPSLADPAMEVGTPITFDASGATSHGYVELDLGDMKIPEDGNLGGVVIEIWARRVSGSGNLFLNLTRHLPNTPGKDELTRVLTEEGASQTWLGKDLLTPSEPVGLTAGAVSGNDLLLNAATEAGGTPPNTGLAWAAGRNRITFDIDEINPAGVAPFVDYTVRVRNITDDNYPVSRSFVDVVHGHVTRVIEFDSVAGKSYQPQVVVDGAGSAGSSLAVHFIHRNFRPTIGQNQQAYSDPERSGRGLEKRDSSGNLVSRLTSEGEVPFVLPPGPDPTAVFVIPLDIPRQGYVQSESVKARTVTLVATGATRHVG